MKTIFTSLLALTLMLSGCDLLKQATTVSISTNLKSDIPVVVAGVKSGQADLSLNAVSFSKSQDLSLSANTDIQPYLNLIEDINLNSLVVTVTGLTGSQTINSLALDVTGVGNIFTQTNITATNNSFTPAVSSTVLEQVATKLQNDKKITLTVSGSASGAMSVTVSLSFDTTVKASPL
jgi:hypothetical protein